MWRGFERYFSRYTESSPNAVLASIRATAIASTRSSGSLGDLHAAASATSRRLDDDGITNVGCNAQRLCLIGDSVWRAGNARDAEPDGRPLGLDLVPHDPDMLRLRADEGDLVLCENVGEARILGEEAIARMDSVRAGNFASRNDRGDVEITVARRRRADAYAFVGQLDVHRVLVGSRIDSHCRNPELLGRAQYPQCDFSSVRDQNLIEHRRRSSAIPAR